MRRIKLTVEYNGQPFWGWQRIQGGPSVQQALEEALFSITHERIELFAAGRTDRGVHATGQVCHFDTESMLPLIKFLDGVNFYVRPYVAVTRVEEVEADFHARFTATCRHYEYHLFNRRQMNPLWDGKAGLWRTALDIDAMLKAVSFVPTGEADWSSFRSSECQSSTPMVHLEGIRLEIRDDNWLVLHISGNHFLHHMVRILMGTLIDVGDGKFRAEDIPTIFAAKDRTRAGQTFMPDGLVLTRVTYPEYRVCNCV
ncbi:MAG: tRNA pseudouridine(38-40) synthase TruA [Alphaproteobacteria bacterium]|nr:tRNA pseudouridine(38-40) synthase TruA [Alphaproteobacteria bacterium]MDD9919979.1 tRNA pseudouridine(38-40) synthase TruA [Alphaproteobacteria bacterium]